MSEEKTVKETRRVIRVALRPTTEKVLDHWRSDLKAAFPTFSPSSSDLVEWAVEKVPALSKKHIQEIRSLFFDEVKELESLLSQIKKVKASGDQESLQTLLREIKGRKTIPTRGKSTPKT